MDMIACQITSLTIVYSIVYSGTDQRKHQSFASLAFVRGSHRGRWIPRTKGQLRGKCFHLMTSSWTHCTQCRVRISRANSWVSTCQVKCGIKLFAHSQTSSVASFDIDKLFHPTLCKLCIYLSVAKPLPDIACKMSFCHVLNVIIGNGLDIGLYFVDGDNAEVNEPMTSINLHRYDLCQYALGKHSHCLAM